VLEAQGDLPGALAAYRNSLAIRKALAAKDPGNTQWQSDLSASDIKIGNVLEEQGDLPGALAVYRDSLAISKALAAMDSGNTGWQRDLSDSHNRIGDVLLTQGDPPGALAAYRDSLAIRKALAAMDPGNTQWQRDLAWSYWAMGLVNHQQNDLASALADFKRASEADPKNAYIALWLDITERRNNIARHLADAAKQLDMTKWPAPVVHLFLGDLTPAQLIAAADDPDEYKKRGQVCEANFYSGELALLQGAKNEANRLFRIAASDCPRSFIEWAAANAELTALGAAP
jgi:lipoprotein NlpI